MDNEFRCFYFSTGTSVGRNCDSSDADGEDGRQSVKETVRQFFKLGAAQNMPQVIPGRLPTAYGSLASSQDQFQAAARAEEAAKKGIADNEARSSTRMLSNLREQPLVDLLVVAGYMRNADRLVKEVLVDMAGKNMDLFREMGLSVSASRATMFTALIARISARNLVLAPA